MGAGQMRFRLLPYVTVEVDDRLRQRVRNAGERLRINVRGYLRSAADDVEIASGRVRDLCDNAVNRVDSAVATVNDKIAPEPAQQTEPENREPKPDTERLEVV
ncbi:hypothetical protein MMAG44476_17557 [Mycolicibacterium mageritense DSM 44476 = CIP 104973]|uniref:Transporter n=2 Tax=Mycobacteriaceae TaxID=1762 RepID=A0ABM7HSB1_MYCME|nr:hypothetical protein MMAGJ_27190 [Mycolicibacterium mageritense]